MPDQIVETGPTLVVTQLKCDYYLGFDGETFRVSAANATECMPLRDGIAMLCVKEQSCVEFALNGLDHGVTLTCCLRLGCCPNRLDRQSNQKFIWTQTLDQWESTLDYVDALLRAGTGHQYLTCKEGFKTILLILSLNE